MPGLLVSESSSVNPVRISQPRRVTAGADPLKAMPGGKTQQVRVRDEEIE